MLKKNANTKGLWSHIQLGHPIDNIELGKVGNEEKVKKSKDNENMRKTSQFNNMDLQPTLKQIFNKNEKYESNHHKQMRFCNLLGRLH